MNFVRSSEPPPSAEEKDVKAQDENMRPSQAEKAKQPESDSDPSHTYPTPQGTDSAEGSIRRQTPLGGKLLSKPHNSSAPVSEPSQQSRQERSVPGPLSRVYQDHEILGLASNSRSSLSHSADPPSPPSSDEEVTFVGRKQSQASRPSSQLQSHTMARPTPQKKLASQSKSTLQVQESSSRRIAPQTIAPAPIEQIPKPIDPSNDFMTLNLRSKDNTDLVQPTFRHEIPSDSRSNKRKRPRRRGLEMPGNDAATQAALEDYLANMQDNNEFAGLNADADAAEMDTDMNGWATEDIEDFGDMSTSEEILDAVSHVLSKRTRESGLQYLVVWEDSSVDEARWIQHQSLPASADPLIKAFEEEEKNIREASAEDDESDDSDDDEEDSEESFALDWGSDESLDENEILGDDDDDFNDDRDLIQRRMERMTDEHIARLYAKQQALGIMDDDLVLFDGIEDIDLSDSNFATKAPNSSRKRSLKRGKAHKKQSKPTFFDPEDALAFEADNYGLFDPMDHDRPSLATGKAKGKGKKAPAFDLELSDSSLADNIRSSWENDRRAKKAKKAEREELRAQGLLGKKNNKNRPDLKARYTDGMSIQALETEFEAFLFQENQQMSLPPMDKRDRKIIHDICGQFGLKSKSQGAGKKRFPVIFKTGRTAEFNDQVFAKLKQTLTRRFFSRMDTKGKGRVQPMRKGATGGGFGGKNALGYREGEIVGAGASEIGQENRGRAMLEKMGWSKGTALGVMGSNGILTPIEHIVKNSKAGLG